MSSLPQLISGPYNFQPKLAPSNIYVPQPVDVANSTFTASPALPPVGWQLGGAGLNTSATLSYDTSTPYGGNQQSLIIDATETDAGISSIAEFLVTFGQVYEIQAALMSISGDPIVAQIIFLDINGNPITDYLSGNGINYSPSVSTQNNFWTGLSMQGTVPFGAVSAQVQIYMAGASGGTGEVGQAAVTLLSNAIPFYLSQIPHQFQVPNSPLFIQLLAVLLQPLVDMGICASAMNQAFYLGTAVGPQLDILGKILGQSRNVTFSNLGEILSAVSDRSSLGSGYVVGDIIDVVQTGGSGGQIKILSISDFAYNLSVVSQGTGYSTATGLSTTGGSGSGLEVNITVYNGPNAVTLDDPDYQILLMAKVLQNQWDGQADSLWNPWQLLFPGGSLLIYDEQNMTADIFLTGNFTPTMQALITQGYIVPRPEAVQYNYSFGNLPLFGFGNDNPSLIAGFGTGSGAYPGGNW